MPQANERFLSSLASARVIEMAVAAWLIARGFLILPVYDFSGKGDDKAPKLLGKGRGLVLPDLLTAKGGVPRFVEVKWKTRAAPPTKCRDNLIETAIDGRLWEHYREVQRITGIEVWVVFVQNNERRIVGGSLDDLDRIKRWSANFAEGRGGYFFPLDWMKRIASFEDVMREGLTR